jgi:hypothetical protein
MSQGRSPTTPVFESEVDGMTDEKIPKQNESTKLESLRAKQDSILLTAIRHTLQGEPRRREVVKGSDDQKELDEQVDKLFVDQDTASLVFGELFPEGVPTPQVFFERVSDLQLRLGWGETAHRVTGLLLSLAAEKLPPLQEEALLRALPEVRSPLFFQFLDSLSVLLSRRELRAEFAAEWFPLLLRRIGNDLASGGFWDALALYCDKYPKNALELLKRLSGTSNEQEISVASYILGSLRCIGLEGQTEADFRDFETSLRHSSATASRAIFHRSWLRTAWCGKMHKADLELLTTRMTTGSAEEREQVFWLVCRSLLSPTISEDSLKFGWHWLQAHVSGDIAPVAKYNVVSFAAQLPPDKFRQAAELVLAVQPIAPEHKGIWKEIEHFLVELLRNNLAFFGQFIAELATRNGHNWLKVLHEPRHFEWLLTEMESKDVAAAIGKLILAEQSECRELGLFFFDKLNLSTLPATVFEKVEETRVALAFYELQQSVIHGSAIGRFLIFLIPLVEQASAALREEFYNELVLQLKNYPGVCKEQFALEAKNFPILQKAIDQVDAYFTELKDAYDSPINQMSISGFNRSARLHSRRMASQVSKGAEELSIFTKLLKKVVLLYGRQWRTFHGGVLGESSGLKEISTSMEFPRMEFIDPEGMQLRRFHASARIRELTPQISPATE